MDTQDGELLTTSEVAELFKVHVRTVSRWADDGKIKAFRTPGGHRRYRRSEVEAMTNNNEG